MAKVQIANYMKEFSETCTWTSVTPFEVEFEYGIFLNPASYL
jgi:hypothetical protein